MRINFDMLKKFEIMMEKFREVKSNSFKNMYTQYWVYTFKLKEYLLCEYKGLPAIVL